MVIYLITNKLNKKSYVGQTVRTLNKRWSEHCAPSNISDCIILHKAIKKYGKENFEINELYKCNSIEELNFLEKYYIKTLNTLSPYGYNLRTGGENSFCTEITKQKISKANKGKKHTEETKRRIAVGNKGKIRTEETRKKLKMLSMGRNNPNFGKKCLEETKQKMSISLSGRKHSEETKQKIAIGNKGKFVSKETKQKMSQAQQGHKEKNSLRAKQFLHFRWHVNRKIFNKKCALC